MTSSSNGRLDGIRRNAGLAGLLVVAVGVCAITGWIVGLDLLKSVVPGQVTMKVNTALCFVVSGAALWVLGGAPSRGAWVAARLGAAWVALLGLDARVRGRWPPAPLLAGIVAALALLALTGYVTRVTSLYGREGVTQMAIPTTIAFLLMAAGLVLARPDLPAMRALLSDTPGGAMLRRFLPVVVIAPVLLAALHLAGEQAGLFHDETGDWYVMAATIVLSVALVLLPARSIDRADAHRRRAEARQAGNERIRRIVETANDAFLSTDPTGRITSWNASPRRIFGWTAEEALGQDLADLLAPEEVRERYGSGAAERDIDGGVERQNALETVARHRDGHVLPVDISVTGVRESDGWVFNCFLRAITGRRRAHQELHGAQLEVLSRLALAAEYRDDDTGEHTGAWASSRHASRSPWACPSPRSS